MPCCQFYAMRRALACSRPRPNLAAAAFVLLAAPALAGAATIPASFHGTWVRGDGTCGAGASLTIAADRVSFANGGQTRRYAKLVVEPSRAGRAKRGTLEVLADLPDGSPFLLFLTPGTPPLVNLNWRPLEDQLARLYPLAPSALKRCPG
jgi:hypothetical protein